MKWSKGTRWLRLFGLRLSMTKGSRKVAQYYRTLRDVADFYPGGTLAVCDFPPSGKKT